MVSWSSVMTPGRNPPLSGGEGIPSLPLASAGRQGAACPSAIGLNGLAIGNRTAARERRAFVMMAAAARLVTLNCALRKATQPDW